MAQLPLRLGKKNHQALDVDAHGAQPWLGQSGRFLPTVSWPDTEGRWLPEKRGSWLPGVGDYRGLLPRIGPVWALSCGSK